MLTPASTKHFTDFLNNAQRFLHPKFFLFFLQKVSKQTLFTAASPHLPCLHFLLTIFTKSSILVKYFPNSTVYQFNVQWLTRSSGVLR